MPVDFKPSDVHLGPVPLCGTLERCEIECAAALMIGVLQVLELDWQRLTPLMMGTALRSALDAKLEPYVSWNTNPFLRPDFDALLSKGFVKRYEDDRSMELTDAALNRIRRWVTPKPNAGGTVADA
jgi:hypothetical protein